MLISLRSLAYQHFTMATVMVVLVVHFHLNTSLRASRPRLETCLQACKEGLSLN